MNPYEAPEPCTDEKTQRGWFLVLLLMVLTIVVFGPPATFWICHCFKETEPHTTFREDVVGYMLIASWQASIGLVIAITLIPYLLRLICIS